MGAFEQSGPCLFAERTQINIISLHIPADQTLITPSAIYCLLQNFSSLSVVPPLFILAKNLLVSPQ